MGTIIARRRADGTTGYSARIALQRDGKIHRETKTFDRKPAASAWIQRREKELNEPGGFGITGVDNPTLARVITRYIEESKRPIGKTQAQVLRAIQAADIGGVKCSKLTSADVVSFAQDLMEGGRLPQTVGNYLAHLGTVVAIAKPAWGYPLDPEIVRNAGKVTKRLGLTAKSAARTRRPSLDELDRLMAHFGERLKRRRGTLPMQWIVAAALFTTRRQEEMTRLLWADLDEGRKRILVRDMKHPGEKKGNHHWCELPDPAMQILLAMPKTHVRIFPFNTDAISAAFTRACHYLGIEDLHYHDLRHEGISRLFEMGWQIPQVAMVSAHQSWTSLKHYTHLNEAGDKYAGWPWLEVVTSPAPAAFIE